MLDDKEKQVLDLRKEGYSYSGISKILGICKSTVVYLAKRSLNRDLVKKINNKKEKQDEYEKIVCQVAKEAKSWNNLCILMNKRPTNNNYSRFKKIIEKYNIDTSYFSDEPILQHISKKKLTLEEHLSLRENVIPNGKDIKKLLLKNNLKEYKCECCGNAEWNNKEIPLQLHHINGNRYDNRLENLQLLCPNCHSQTDNFAGKNINHKKRKKYICQCCGKEFYLGDGSSKHSRIYCSTACRDKMNGQRNQYVNTQFKDYSKKIERPSKEQLYNDFKELGGFKAIGRKYKVSDNSIKKWFKSFGMETSSKIIRYEIIEKFGKQPQWYEYYRYDENGNRKGFIYKKIDVFDLNHNFIKTYDNIKEVVKELNLKEKSIRKSCTEGYSLYGYYFKYHNDN